jgi:uncharacterized protein (DUF488 family)
MLIWSVGHSNESFDEFRQRLRAADIEAVADIRTVPKSRRHPQFRNEALTATLPPDGVAYLHIPRLGGWRRAAADSPNTGWRNTSFRGYADYAMTEEFAAGLAELRALGAGRRTAMMCSEVLWWRCHRRLVADRLVVAGDEVRHIVGDRDPSPHQLTPFAVVTTDGQITYPAPSRPA